MNPKNKEEKVPRILKYRLGVWNIYFAIALYLAFTGYIHLNFLLNFLFALFLIFPIKGKFLSFLRELIAVICGAALLYHESFLPGLASFQTNAQNLTKFSWKFLADFARDFINIEMVGIFILIFFLYFVLKNFIRVGLLVLVCFCVLAYKDYFPEETPEILVAENEVKSEVTPVAQAAVHNGLEPPQAQKADNDGINRWLTQFFSAEGNRRASIPTTLPASATPFDIILLHTCSLGTDDVNAVGLDNHPLWKKFDINLNNFNSVTTYSGPATLRLLSSACGQPSNDELYKGRRQDCETMNLLGNLGFKQYAFIDDTGGFHNWLENLKKLGGLNAELSDESKYPALYDSFFGVKVRDTREIMKDYLNKMKSDDPKSSVTLLRFTTLHDGNRQLGSDETMPYQQRAEKYFDDIDWFLKELEKSGRKVMVVFAPEHGAAIRGDKVQVARLREIPSPNITKVPAKIKFINIDRPLEQVNVDDPVSWQALGELIGRTVGSDFFSSESNSTIPNLATDLPKTWKVSENQDAAVVRYKGRDYVRLSKGKWIPYGG